ncbi:MAG: TonB-dependent receptor [Pseudomonadota bacterium]
MSRWLLAAFLWFWAPQAFAQASLEVRVLSADGAPLQGAAVVIENAGLGQRFERETDGAGRARVTPMAAAAGWSVRALAGQTSAFAGPFQLRNDFTRTLTLRLSSEAALESIMVTGRANAISINSSNAEISSTLTAAQIARLPVEARSLERLLFRLPGVTQSTGFFGEAPSIAINGANALYTNYMIDGLDNNENFLGGLKFAVPIGAVQDVTVLVSSYSAEFGRTANGIVNVTTPSGSNDVAGEFVFVTRPGGFLTETPDGTQTSLFGQPVADSFERYQGAATLSGPLIKDKVFGFINAEYIRDETQNLLSSQDLDINAVLPGTNTQLLLTGRLDAQLSEAWRASARINYGDVELERPGGGLDGGVTFPSAGSVQDRQSLNAALQLSYNSDRLGYSGALQYSRFRWDFGQPLNGPGPQATLFSQGDLTRPVAIIGHPGFIFDERESTWQTRHTLTYEAGKHRLKGGIDFILADFALAGGGNVNGNFALSVPQAELAALGAAGAQLSIADVPTSAQIIDAVFETQPNRFGRTQQLYSAFLEDQWQLRSDFSLTFGLRYDYDSLTNSGAGSDTNNISPRFGFNYLPHPDVSIRGGVGRFVEKIPYAVISDALQQGSQAPAFLSQLEDLRALDILPSDADLLALTSNEGNRTISPMCAAPFMCPDPMSLRTDAQNQPIAERRIFSPFGLENPEALQASLSVEWQVAPDLIIGVDAQYSRGRNLLRLVDLNAPAPFDFNQAAFDALGADDVAALSPAQREAMGLVRSTDIANASRPTTGLVRSILYTDSGGRSRYKALIFKIQKARGNDIYYASLFYTLSRLENDTDDINFRADDANRFDRDFGPSLNDRTHVISGLFTLYPVDGLTLSLAGLIQSGQPINFTPDPAVFGTTDLNGDGLSIADQFTGNPDRFPGVGRNSGRLGWNAVFDVGLGYALETPAGTVSLRGDVFNVLDANRDSGFPVNFTVSNQVQTFGQPFNQTSAGQARTFQLTARYAF